MFNRSIITGASSHEKDCTTRRGAELAPKGRPRWNASGGQVLLRDTAPRDTRNAAHAKYDFWLVNGAKEFGHVPAALTSIPEVNLPICLQRGHQTWGATHMQQRHGRWFTEHDVSPAELLWKKCRESGVIYASEERYKFKIHFRRHPACVLVIRYIPGKEFFTATTMYDRRGPLDGERLGAFTGLPSESAEPPTFELSGPSPAPQIYFKRPRCRLAVSAMAGIPVTQSETPNVRGVLL